MLGTSGSTRPISALAFTHLEPLESDSIACASHLETSGDELGYDCQSTPGNCETVCPQALQDRRYDPWNGFGFALRWGGCPTEIGQEHGKVQNLKKYTTVTSHMLLDRKFGSKDSFVYRGLFEYCE